MDFNKTLAKTRELIKNKKYTQAEYNVTKLLKLRPTHLEALYYRALVNSEKCNFAISNKLLKRCLDHKDLSPKQGSMVIKLIERNDRALQNNISLSSDELNEDDVKAIYQLIDNEMYEEALNYVSNYDDKISTSLHYNTICGICHSRTRNSELALKHFSNCVKMSPKSADAHNNLGRCYLEFGMYEDSEKEFRQSLTLNSYHEDATEGLAIVQKRKENFDEAISLFEKVLKVNPFNTEALNNLGGIYSLGRNTEKAVRCFAASALLIFGHDFFEFDIQKLLPSYFSKGKLHKTGKSVSSDYKSTILHNFGHTLFRLGYTVEGASIIKKAISFNPVDPSVWDAAYFAANLEDPDIFFAELKGSIHDDLSSFYSMVTKYKVNSIEDYEFDDYRKVLTSLAPKIVDKKPKATEYSSNLDTQIVCLYHYGRSGTGMLHGLLDNHPEMFSLPTVFFSEFFNPSMWDYFTKDGLGSVPLNIIKAFPQFFDAASTLPNHTLRPGHKLVAFYEGLTTLGDKSDEIFQIDTEKFVAKFDQLSSGLPISNLGDIFSIFIAALRTNFNQSTGTNRTLYHIHNPSIISQINFEACFPCSKKLLLVRDPIQSLESWLRSNIKALIYPKIIQKIMTMLEYMYNPIFATRSFSIKLESIKNNPRSALKSLSDALEISFSDSMLSMTVAGLKWWGDPTSPSYNSEGSDPFGKEAINRRIGTVFTARDQLLLENLFSVHYFAFDYERNYENLSVNRMLSVIEEPFDFELKLASDLSMPIEKFKTLGFYRYFRRRLKSHLNREFNGIRDTCPVLIA